MRFEVQLASSTGKRTHTVDLERMGDQWRIILDGEPVDADVVEIAPNTLSILIRGESHEIRIVRSPEGLLSIQTGLREFTAEVTDQRSWRGRRLGHVEVRRTPADHCADGRQGSSLAGEIRRNSGSRARPSGRRSHENAKRNSFHKIRHRRAPSWRRRAKP